jgi:predicted RNA-binding protein with PUA-like domain
LVFNRSAANQPQQRKTFEMAKQAAQSKAVVTKKSPAALAQPEHRYWLLKSEPDVFSWDNQKARGAAGEPWTGVRNYLARNNMRAMQRGDLAFFYHSNIGKEIVGIVRVIATAHPDPDDTKGTWQCVDVEAVCDLKTPVGLAAVKAHPELANMALVTSMRLSVQPVTAPEWAVVCRLGGLDQAVINAALKKLSR